MTNAQAIIFAPRVGFGFAPRCRPSDCGPVHVEGLDSVELDQHSYPDVSGYNFVRRFLQTAASQVPHAYSIEKVVSALRGRSEL